MTDMSPVTLDATALVRDMALAARAALPVLAQAPTAQKAQALNAAADALIAKIDLVLAANARDMAAGAAKGLTAAMLDRLKLDTKRVRGIADGLRDVAHLSDPVGRVLSEWTRPNGLVMQKVAVPLGVIGVIYESRPNVTADAAALSLMAGNAVILRGGSESRESSAVIHTCLVEGLVAAGLPTAAVQLVPVSDRAVVGALLGAHGLIDIIVPRGGKSLVARVQQDARVPVIAHLDGNNHVYVDKAADLAMARSVLLNAKMRRTGVCGAAETLLIDRAAAPDVAKILIADLLNAGCAVRADAELLSLDPRLTPATATDWDTEYLDAVIAAKAVAGIDGALAHIARHGSGHTDAIITADQSTADRFLASVDSAIVLHNASTQFADGGEFGFGAEIGISTGRLHARGPVGVDQLTTFKYVVRGSGQIRPV
jgi:glutamate-5-semialdehyde dehydrogenase